MNDKSQVNVQSQFAAGLVPCVDGIVFPDGRVRQILLPDYYMLGYGDKDQPVIGDWTTVEQLMQSEDFSWDEFDEGFSVFDETRDLRAFSGHFGYEDEGMIALVANHTGEFIWIAQFLGVEVFRDVRIAGGHVLAENNNDVGWRIPIRDPERLELSYPSR